MSSASPAASGSGPVPGPSSADLITKFTNVTILRKHELVVDDLWVRGSRIIDPQERFWEAGRSGSVAADRVVDGAGLILAPGYIDLQLNGAFGYDFSNPDDMAAPTKPGDLDRITEICRGVLRHGVTSIYATVITSSPSTYQQLRPLVKRREGSATQGAHILGLHLEGPFITVPGAHPPPLLRNGKNRNGAPAAAATNVLSHSDLSPLSPSPSPSPPPSTDAEAAAAPVGGIDGLAEVQQVYSTELLAETSIITLAPEIHGVAEVISTLSAAPHNIVISAGHSKASYNQSVTAMRLGARLITHLFNAMSSFHHRDPGLIGLIGCNEVTQPKDDQDAAGVASGASKQRAATCSSSSLRNPPPPGLFYSLIVDGYHTHPASVKIAYNTHPSGAVLVTDAMLAMGLQDGKYRFGEIAVEIKNGMAHVDGTNTLAGSIATMEQCVQNFHAFTGCSLVSAIETATLHPAQCMRLQSKGALDVGMDADLILLDRQLKVHGCWVMGEMAWKNEEANITVTESNKQ